MTRSHNDLRPDLVDRQSRGVRRWDHPSQNRTRDQRPKRRRMTASKTVCGERFSPAWR